MESGLPGWKTRRQDSRTEGPQCRWGRRAWGATAVAGRAGGHSPQHGRRRASLPRGSSLLHLWCLGHVRARGLTETGCKRPLTNAGKFPALEIAWCWFLSLYLGDTLDSSRSFLNSSLASSSLLFFSLYSSFILVLTNCSNILKHTHKKRITRLHIRNEILGLKHNTKEQRETLVKPFSSVVAGAEATAFQQRHSQQHETSVYIISQPCAGRRGAGAQSSPEAAGAADGLGARLRCPTVLV